MKPLKPLFGIITVRKNIEGVNVLITLFMYFCELFFNNRFVFPVERTL